MSEAIPPPRGRLWAILHRRCPRCREGEIFAGRFQMNPRCPKCGLIFQREAGYFLGAMYFSYMLSSLVLVGVGLALWVLVLRSWEPQWVVLLAMLVLTPLAPAVFRYSRVLWIHFDRFFDP